MRRLTLACLRRGTIYPVRAMSSSSSSSSSSSGSAPSAVSAPSTSASPCSSFTASTAPFRLCHSPLFSVHRHARSPHPLYPQRLAVKDEQVDFSHPWPDYAPSDFTVGSTLNKSPDPSDPSSIPDWSHRPPSSYPFVLDPTTHRPLNPLGRTGLQGRGKLYFWGPNHAADCILTRANSEGKEGEREVLVIKRKDTGEYALVGGMIDKGETPEECIEREFGEEVMGIAEDKGKADQRQQAALSAIFAPSNRRVVYRGYVDDARNTDNGWIETCAFMFDWPSSLTREEGERLFVGGSDAAEVKWIPLKEGDQHFDHLYASHKPMVLMAVKQRGGGGGEGGDTSDGAATTSKM